jgi:hypothetical protein
MSNMKSYGGRTLVSAETSTIDLDKEAKKGADEEKKGVYSSLLHRLC